MESTQMAKATNGAKKSAPRVNKPRTFYMVYKGNLDMQPEFIFDKDALVDKMTQDRELKVERITVPTTRRPRKSQVEAAPAPTA